MLAIIGGTGLNQLQGLQINETKWFATSYGDPSAAIQFGTLEDFPVVFMARHGEPHKIAPHLINYRANIDALRQAGVTRIIAVNAVGGIAEKLGPAQVAVPDQIIDYTYGREHTFFDGEQLEHVDFSYPYSESLRAQLIHTAQTLGITISTTGVYGATQGPRLETAAEIARCARDGCTMVGMTGMPEAVLAREAGLEYACIALSVNWAAGITESIITMEEIEAAIDEGMGKIREILQGTVRNLATAIS